METDLSGFKIGEPEVLAPIGRRAMGKVYEGRQPEIGRRVAIKVPLKAYSNLVLVDTGHGRPYVKQRDAAMRVMLPLLVAMAACSRGPSQSASSGTGALEPKEQRAARAQTERAAELRFCEQVAALPAMHASPEQLVVERKRLAVRCLDALAIRFDEPGLCLVEHPDPTECLERLASHRGNVVACRYIWNEDRRRQCYLEAVTESGDAKGCDLYQGAWRLSAQPLCQAVAARDAAACAAVKTSDSAVEDCVIRVAMGKKDPKLCEGPASGVRARCLTAIAIRDERLGLCPKLGNLSLTPEACARKAAARAAEANCLFGSIACPAPAACEVGEPLRSACEVQRAFASRDAAGCGSVSVVADCAAVVTK
jgi:hypothetical protein